MSNLTMVVNGATTTLSQDSTIIYEVYDDDSTHRVGWYLTFASAIGFIGVIYSLRKGRDYE